MSDDVTLEDIIADDKGRFRFGPAYRIDFSDMPKIPPDEPSWESFKDKDQEYLLYAGPQGLRCWQLMPDGTQHEVTAAVIPEQHCHPAAPPVCKNCKKLVRENQALFLDKDGKPYHQPGSTICKP